MSFPLPSLLSDLQQTRKISFKIIHSTTNLLPKWRAHVSETEFKDQVLPRDVATRWNSTFDMLSAFLQMKDLVSGFLDHSSYQLVEYILDDDEWEAIEGLVSVLKEATIFFSTDSPGVSSVVPAMDAIDETLASGIIDEATLSAPVRHALSLGKKTLNKYYELTDDSYIYRIAIGMYSFRNFGAETHNACSSSSLSQAGILQ
ncbi:hypothetical protein F5880DRAFT_1494561 [Lentinula raphanica]|nr:hypothetical protein F5880DRAFT_1494561 [Lentinula raphanica]